jgi:hypothetical protein
MKEREEERQIEELRKLQMEATGKTNLIDSKVAWMYQDQTGGIEKEASEAYLLGKRRVDQIILKQDSQKEDSKKTEDPLASALSIKDISSKAALDPLLAIEKQRTANLQALMADPIARRRLMKDMSRDKTKDEKKSERRRHRDRNSDHHRSKRRRYSNDSDDRRERRRHRDDSEDGKRDHGHHRGGSENGKRERQCHQDYDDDRRESRRHRDEAGQRDRRHIKEGDNKDWQEYRSVKDYRRRSCSRSRSPFRKQRQEHVPRDSDSRTISPDQKRETAAEERTAKLAAMSANASDLEVARNRRLAEMEARDAAAKERDDRTRDRRGDRFVNDLREQAGTKSLGDRLQRASGGLVKLEDRI